MVTSRFLGLRLTVFFCFVLLSAGTSLAAGVPAETDCWATQPGTAAKVPPLPPGFFGPGSDPFAGALVAVTGVPLTAPELASCLCPPAPQTTVTWVDIHGDPVPAGSVHKVSQVPAQAPVPDTCIRRLSPATFPGGIGVPEVIPIELVQLSLVSVAPIVVTFSGVPHQYNVLVTENGVQAQGTMELTPSALGLNPSGSVRVPNLPIDVRFSFVPIGPGNTAILNGNVNMQNPNPQIPGGQPGHFAVLASPPVPTMPIAGLILLTVVLTVLGVELLRRRRVVDNATT